MKRSLLGRIIVPIFFLSLCLKAESISYVVKNGDTLSNIIFKHFDNTKFHIYGSGKMLDKVLRQNRALENPDMIFPGQTIVLNIVNIVATNNGQPAHQEIHVYIPPKTSNKTSPLPIAMPVVKRPAEPTSNTTQVTSEKRAPASQAMQEAAPTFTPYGWFDVQPSMGFSRIVATEDADGSQATMLSKPLIGLEGLYVQKWNDHLETFLIAGFRQEDFEDVSNRTITNLSTTRAWVGIGATRYWKPWLSSRFEGVARQRSFVRATSSTALEVDPVFIPEVRMMTQFRILQAGPFTLAAQPYAAYLFASSTDEFSVQSGYTIGGRMELTQRLSFGAIVAQGHLQYDQQKTSITDQNTMEISGSIGLRIFVGRIESTDTKKNQTKNSMNIQAPK